jgi:hypothetical protein
MNTKNTFFIHRVGYIEYAFTHTVRCVFPFWQKKQGVHNLV